MSKWKEIKTYTEVNPYNGQPVEEDAPANSVAGGGVDLSIDKQISRKKKKTLIDARSKSYKQHRAKLEKARAKREERKSKLAQKVSENIGEFSRELNEVNVSSYIVGELRNIVKNKSAKNIKFKDGSMKVDMTTANMMLQVLSKIKSATKKKIMDMLDKGKKSDFLKFHGLVMKVIK
tara:strand:+ start:814 stop:1344 length:531 start_codon:yes stop_codon:yes gene_type:complete